MSKIKQNLRRKAILAPHTFYTGKLSNIVPEAVTNLVHKATGEHDLWIEEATSQIGEWRALSRSVYLRWALTINACEVAEKYYLTLPNDKSLQTNALRMVGGAPEQVVMQTWSGPEAAQRYSITLPLVAAHGVSDLYGAIEDILFELAEIFYRHNPRDIMQGKEEGDRLIRRLWNGRSDSEAANNKWRAAWDERYANWRRRKIYDGLPRLLRSLFRAAELKRPSHYKHTDIDTWSETLEMVALLRHHAVHGAPTVSAELAALSGRPTSMTFDFKEGETLDVKLHHLQSVECFVDKLLDALNISLIEKACGGPLI